MTVINDNGDELMMVVEWRTTVMTVINANDELMMTMAAMVRRRMKGGIKVYHTWSIWVGYITNLFI